MTGHLPDCRLCDPCVATEHGHVIRKAALRDVCFECEEECICDRLRACEARVREERRRVRATVIPILVALARYTPTDTNAEQTEQVINRAVMRIKSAIDNEEE